MQYWPQNSDMRDYHEYTQKQVGVEQILAGVLVKTRLTKAASFVCYYDSNHPTYLEPICLRNNVAQISVVYDRSHLGISECEGGTLTPAVDEGRGCLGLRGRDLAGAGHAEASEGEAEEDDGPGLHLVS